MRIVGRASVPKSAVVAPRSKPVEAEPTPPAAGCVDGYKYHKWIEINYKSHARTCARRCGARGWVDPNGQVKRVDESVAAVRQA